ncbi:MAG: hotdog domain-containing protein [Planctomycetota bacterium]|jgi:3-hydroxyacyl-[acyl-carrier-protein] dehydratase
MSSGCAATSRGVPSIETDSFLGFGAMENVKFRGAVVPGDRLVLVARKRDLRRRRAVFDCQGFVDGRMVFEGTIVGMVM